MSQSKEEESSLVALRTAGERPPLFCCAVSDLQVVSFARLSQELGNEQPFYVLWPPARASGKGKWRVEEIAERYLEEIWAVQPEGPYHLCGFCGAGRVAYEVAQASDIVITSLPSISALHDVMTGGNGIDKAQKSGLIVARALTCSTVTVRLPPPR